MKTSKTPVLTDPVAIIACGLILEELLPSLNGAMGFGLQHFPARPDLDLWWTGVLFGAVATSCREDLKDDPDRVEFLAAGINELLEELFEDGGGPALEPTLRRLAPEAFPSPEGAR